MLPLAKKVSHTAHAKTGLGSSILFLSALLEDLTTREISSWVRIVEAAVSSNLPFNASLKGVWPWSPR